MKNFKKTFTTLSIVCMTGAMLTGCSGKNDIDKDFINQAVNEALAQQTADLPQEETPQTEASQPQLPQTEAPQSQVSQTEAPSELPETEAQLPEAPETKDIVPEDVMPGENMSTAGIMPLETQISGTIPEDSVWYSFTTNDNPDAIYKIMVENITSKSDSTAIEITIIDEFGSSLDRRQYIGNNGSIDTLTFEDAEPNTTYYLKLRTHYDNECKYNVIIKIKE